MLTFAEHITPTESLLKCYSNIEKSNEHQGISSKANIIFLILFRMFLMWQT